MELPVKIILENEYSTNTYYAGKTVSGKIKCVFREDDIVRAIRITYEGYANTKWYANPTGKAGTTFSAEDVYFREEHTVFEGNAANDHRIPAGTHMYPFTYTLPEALPTSFADYFGKIEYKIKVIVDRPWNINYVAEQLLSVISPLDLNLLSVRKSFSQSLEENLIAYCCRNAGEITFSVYLPIVGYAADQKINVGTYVRNMSNVNVTAVQFEIVRTNEYLAREPFPLKKYFPYKLTNCTTGAIGAHAEKSWTTTLQVPLEKLLNLSYCNIMQVAHHLEVKVVLPFPHSNLKITCPITLGTVPLTGVDTNTPGTPPTPTVNIDFPLGNSTVLQNNNVAGGGVPHSNGTPAGQSANEN